LHEVIEFSSKFPGSAPLVIEAFDYDDLFGDDLIGKTSIDLDDRYFSPEWMSLMEKPIEYRDLYHPSTSLPQGTLLCWVDIFKQGKSKNADNAWDITPEPISDYQLRLAIYDTQNVPMEDAEGTSDVFVKAWIDDKDQRETDTHWRCTNGSASFNYRLLFDFKSPTYNKSEKEAYKLKLAIYDRDIFASNDYICTFEIDLRLLVLDCRLSKKCIHLSKKYYDSYLKSEVKK
jgi:Ca2+-dependent lipid-binding protein